MSAAAVVVALANSVWQGITLVAVVALALRLASRINAATACAVWSATFVAIALLPLADLAMSRSGIPGPALAPTIQVAAGVLARTGDRFGPMLLLGWLVIAAGLLFLLARNGVALLRLKRDARPLDGPVSRAADGRPGRRRATSICVSERVGIPCAAGFADPMVLVPATLATSLDEGDLTRIVLHEAAHLDRFDDWSNAAERFLRAIFFFQPGLLLAGARIDLERELACDDRVLAATGEPVRYAECLTAIVESQVRRRRPSIVPGFFVGRSQVAARIARLVDRERNATVGLSRPFAFAFPAVAVAAACIATVQITFAPVPAATSAARPWRASTVVSRAATHPSPRANRTIASNVVRPPAAVARRTQRPAVRATRVAMTSAVPTTINAHVADRAPQLPRRHAMAAASTPIRAVPATPGGAPHAPAAIVAQTEEDAPETATAPADAAQDQSADQALATALTEAGLQPSADDLATLVDHGVTSEFVLAAVTEGVHIPSMRALRSISGRGLSHSFVVAAVHHVAPVAFDDVVALRDAEVSAAYLDNLAAAGYDRLSSRDAIALNENAVTPEYACDIAEAGYPHLPARDLIALHDDGVDGNFLRALARKGYRGLSPADIVRLRDSADNS